MAAHGRAELSLSPSYGKASTVKIGDTVNCSEVADHPLVQREVGSDIDAPMT